MDATTDLRILDGDRFRLEQSAECGIPGYLILRLKGPAASLARLDPEDAATVMRELARAARAVERVVAAERVYLLSFCEVDPRFHVHLFPRTRWLLGAHRAATGAGDGPANGPRLFEWARTAYPPGCPLPPASPTMAQACAELRRLLAPRRRPEEGGD